MGLVLFMQIRTNPRSSGSVETLLHPQALIQRLRLISLQEHTGCSVVSFSREEKTTDVTVIKAASVVFS